MTAATSVISRSALWGILKKDGLRVRRDRFMGAMVLYIVGISIVMRWALPWMDSALERRLSFDLTPWYPLAVSHIVIQLAGLIGGIVGGLLLVEAHEDQTIKAQLVTPVSITSYLWILGVTVSLFTVAVTMVESVAIGHGLPPYPTLFVAAVLGAPGAMGFALFIGAMASNKTEALVYLKIAGLGPLLASGAYFLPEPWQWFAGLYPPYWASKLYWVAESGDDGWWLMVIGGLIVSAVWLGVLHRVFLRRLRS